jgi:hypothetical protein
MQPKHSLFMYRLKCSQETWRCYAIVADIARTKAFLMCISGLADKNAAMPYKLCCVLVFRDLISAYKLIFIPQKRALHGWVSKTSFGLYDLAFQPEHIEKDVSFDTRKRVRLGILFLLPTRLKSDHPTGALRYNHATSNSEPR